MKNRIVPTNPVEEEGKGRIALCLDPEDLHFLAEQYQNLPEDSSEEVVKNWARIHFRVHSALHKAGLK